MAQLEAAFSFFASVGPEKFELSDFENNCGVGIEVSNEEIERTVDKVFEDLKTTILEQRYKTNVGDLFRRIRDKQPWADPKIVKQVVDAKLIEFLGERTAAHDEKPVKKKKEKPAKVEEKAVVSAPTQPSEEELNPFSIFPSPKENLKVHTEIFFSDGSILRACNTKEILDKHLKVTKEKVLTRFPPEPNGYLHIGHAKALYFQFGIKLHNVVDTQVALLYLSAATTICYFVVDGLITLAAHLTLKQSSHRAQLTHNAEVLKRSDKTKENEQH